jgi:hypothetical protein
MKQYTFLPMTIQNDEVIISEPFASKISESFPKDSISVKADYISISIKNIERKEEFVDNIASSIKRIQKDMISSYLNKNTMRYL